MYRTEQEFSGFTGNVNADAGTIPTRHMNGYLVAMSTDGVALAATQTLSLKVKISMWVEFFDRVDLVG